jgi:hypothetical protein
MMDQTYFDGVGVKTRRKVIAQLKTDVTFVWGQSQVAAGRKSPVDEVYLSEGFRGRSVHRHVGQPTFAKSGRTDPLLSDPREANLVHGLDVQGDAVDADFQGATDKVRNPAAVPLSLAYDFRI